MANEDEEACEGSGKTDMAVAPSRFGIPFWGLGAPPFYNLF